MALKNRLTVKYNGKEFDRTHGLDWYDYSARQYDPASGRFTSMDPLCEKYYNISPYSYCAGNPIRYVDPDGRDIWITDGDEKYKYEQDCKYDGTNKFITGVCGLLNDLCSDDAGQIVVNTLCSSDVKYTYLNQKPTNKGVNAAFNDKTQTFAIGNLDTHSFAHETFHAYQYDNGMTGRTAVREVEAFMFEGIMNNQVEGWDFLSNSKVWASKESDDGNTYTAAMINLIENGFNASVFSSAVSTFLTGYYSGDIYQKNGYTTGIIPTTPLISTLLPTNKSTSK